MKLKLRTKAEIACVVALLLIISVISVMPVTLTFTDDNVNVNTFIRNSNGNIWSTTGANIQAAIDDLNGNLGIVWLPGNTTITTSSTITLGVNTIVDMQGCIIKPDSSFDVVSIKSGSQLLNGKIDVTEVSFKDRCILFDGGNLIRAREADISTMVKNVGLRSTNQNGTAIELRADSKVSNEYVVFATCSYIQTDSFEYCIFLNNTGGAVGNDNYLNSNTFENIQSNNDKYVVWMERNTSLTLSQSGVEGNSFESNIVQCNNGTIPTYTYQILYCEGGTNTFEFIVWDWNYTDINGQNPSYEFTSGANYNKLEFTGAAANMSDNGIGNTIMDYGSSRLHVDLLAGGDGYFNYYHPTDFKKYLQLNYDNWDCTQIFGTAEGDDDMRIQPNSVDYYPQIFMKGHGTGAGTRGNIYLSIDAGDSIIFESDNITFIDADNDSVTIYDILNLNPITIQPGSPDEGDVMYNDTLNKVQFYNGAAWETFNSSV